MNTEPHISYNDSKFKWIAEIPNGWKIRRLKYNCLVNPPTKKKVLDSSTKVNFLPMEKVSENGNYDIESEAEFQDVAKGYTYFEDNDVLLAKITPCFENGKGALIKNLKHSFGFGSTEFHVLRSNNVLLPKYIYFLTKSHLFRTIGEAFMEGTAGQKRVSSEFIKNITIPIPPLSEQEHIITYLNKKDTEINTIIEKYTNLIKILKEKKDALVTHIITNGLDSNVELKSSNIEYLDKIPKHWNVKKLKYEVRINQNNLTDNTHPDYEFIYLDISNVTEVGEIVSTEFMNFENAPSRARRLPEENDTIISTVRTYLKAIAYLENIPKNLVVSTGFAVLHTLNNVYPKFLYYIITSEPFVQTVMANSKGVAYPAINSTELGNIQIWFPSLEEQRTISSYLDQETMMISKLIHKVEEQIRLLNEHKTSLINEVVSGLMLRGD